MMYMDVNLVYSYWGFLWITIGQLGDSWSRTKDIRRTEIAFGRKYISKP